MIFSTTSLISVLRSLRLASNLIFNLNFVLFLEARPFACASLCEDAFPFSLSLALFVACSPATPASSRPAYGGYYYGGRSCEMVERINRYGEVVGYRRVCGYY